MVVKIAIVVKEGEDVASRVEWKNATLQEIGIALAHLELKKRSLLEAFEKGTAHIRDKDY